MTTRPRDLDAVLSAYFGEGPSEAPDRAIDDTLDQLEHIRQDRRQWQPWRYGMSTPTRVALAAAAAVVLVVAGFAFLRQPPGPVGGSPGPSVPGSPAPSSIASTTPTTAAPSTSALAPAELAQIGAGKKAVTRADAAIKASATAGSISTADAGLLSADLDAVRISLGEQSLTLARTNYGSLTTRLGNLSPAPTGPTADEVGLAVEALGNTLEAVAIPTGTIPAGSYFSSGFTKPVIVLGVGDGWSRYLDDSEVFALQQGVTDLAFHHTATAATPEAMAAAIGHQGTGDFTEAPAPVAYGPYAGFVGQASAGATLWFDSGLRAYDPSPGDVVRIWVLTVEGRPLTIELVGQPAEVAALRPQVEAMLQTFVAYQAP